MNTQTAIRVDDFKALGLNVSEAARDLYTSMGRGATLRIPHDGTQPQLILFTRDHRVDLKQSHREPVSLSAFADLAATGLIHQLTELGEPPVDKRINLRSWRQGWREMGYDGDVADWWVCTQ
jgi:hypothetical protein